MSATAGRQALTAEEKAARANETSTQKLVRLGGPRVNRALDAMQRVGDLGSLIKAAAKEGIDGQSVVSSIQNALAEKFKEMSVKLQTGERTKSGFQIEV